MQHGSPSTRTDPILEVRESDGNGYYPVIFRGVEYALTSEPRLEVGAPNYFDDPFSNPTRRYALTVQFMDLPPKPKPKPKRRMTDLGLRRPR